MTTQSPSLLVATPCPFEDEEDEDEVDAPPEDDRAPVGPVVDDVTPFGPAVTWLDMRPASLRLVASPEERRLHFAAGFSVGSGGDRLAIRAGAGRNRAARA